MERKQNQTIRENPCSRITVWKGARDSRIPNAGRDIHPGGSIDEQTTTRGAFLTLAVNFAIFNSLIAVCRALSAAKSGASCFSTSPQG
ncbi:hypothetical protein CDAR_499261 [Caerostris darwini]|uniref:Uncharacterized protein n=1 Tax=Caerostris darwini TaxID=1538125 RepID=A0AAV4NZQ8_9ARAC|nr:hypothetical protein CDAR_499261 [Caerostris darwini]